MSMQNSSGGVLKCSFGQIPAVHNVLPINQVMSTTPAANIGDSKPMLNIPTFGLCSSPLNPLVVANFGAPAPCLPNIVTPWLPGAPDVFIGNMPACNEKSQCICAFGGAVSCQFSGQVFNNSGK